MVNKYGRRLSQNSFKMIGISYNQSPSNCSSCNNSSKNIWGGVWKLAMFAI